MSVLTQQHQVSQVSAPALSERSTGRPAAVLRFVVGTFVRGATALPLAVAAVPMALTGSGRRAARAQQAVIRRFSPHRAGPVRPTGNPLRVVTHSLLVAIPALASFVAVGLALFGVGSGYLYFLRSDANFALGHPFSTDHRFDHAWGGPTLVGAWFAHSCVAFGIQLAALGLVHLLTAAQDRLTRRLLTAPTR
ncbi:hypothetical protein [Kitasatospora nipponensis]